MSDENIQTSDKNRKLENLKELSPSEINQHFPDKVLAKCPKKI